MSITKETALIGAKKACEAVALKKMRDYASPDMTTKQFNIYRTKTLLGYGAFSSGAFSQIPYGWGFHIYSKTPTIHSANPRRRSAAYIAVFAIPSNLRRH